MKKMAVIVTLVMAIAFIAGSVFAFEGCGYSGKGYKNNAKLKEMKENCKKELGLTAEQDKALEANRQAHRAEAEAMYEAMKAKKSELKAAMAKPGATKAQIEPIAKELKAIQAKMTDRRIDGILAVKEILTPEQFAKLESMKDKKVKKWGEKSKNRESKWGTCP